MIRSFPKKAAVVDMVQWTGTPESAAEILAWVAVPKEPTGFRAPGSLGNGQPAEARLWVAHQRSWEPLPLGHWVAKELDGNGFYPMSPEGLKGGYDLTKEGKRGHEVLRALVVDFGDEHRCCPIQPILDEIDRLPTVVPVPSFGKLTRIEEPGYELYVGPPRAPQKVPTSTEPSQDQVDYVNDLMEASNIPDSWDDDASADDILKRYFLELERRVLALGGSLEAWPEEDDDGKALRCPTCTSREPRLHPAAGDGGEVTHLCPDAFHTAA